MKLKTKSKYDFIDAQIKALDKKLSDRIKEALTDQVVLNPYISKSYKEITMELRTFNPQIEIAKLKQLMNEGIQVTGEVEVMNI